MLGHRFSRRRRRATAAVEFALLAPLLLMILFGILEVGRIVDAWLVVHNAAREGARAAVLVQSDAAAETAARTATDAYLVAGLSGRTDIRTMRAAAVDVSTTSIDVTAEVQVEIYAPLFQSMFGASAAPVRANAVLRRQ
jgi:Flp pilus assembly protein TadG